LSPILEKRAKSREETLSAAFFRMNRLLVLPVLLLLVSVGSVAASLPVKVTLTGYVMNATLISEKTDFETHSLEGTYEMRPVDRDMKRFDLTSYEGMRVSAVDQKIQY